MNAMMPTMSSEVAGRRGLRLAFGGQQEGMHLIHRHQSAKAKTRPMMARASARAKPRMAMAAARAGLRLTGDAADVGGEDQAHADPEPMAARP